MALQTFLLYLAAWTLVALSPGPAVMFVMSQSARHGLRAAVAFGLAAMLAKFSGAMTAIRIVGALYLMYLGVKMLLSKPRGETKIAANGEVAPARHGIALQGLAVQLTNPKNLMFVLAFLPQFISPERPLLLQLSIMLAVTMLIDAAVLLVYAQIAARGARALRGSRVVTSLERVFGGALIFFGLKLLASRR